MPGFVGGFKVPIAMAQYLCRDFLRRWPGSTEFTDGNVMLCAHAFSGRGVALLGGGRCAAADGEWGLYQEFAELERSAARTRENGEPIRYSAASVGNVAVVDADRGRVDVACDWSGTFPLYYASVDNGLVFSSLLEPLARVFARRPNTLAIIEFLREGYIVGAKTMYEGIWRLLPGQCLHCDDSGMHVEERSQAWVGTETYSSWHELGEQVWAPLTGAVVRSLPERSAGVMMSGGWDSRTLLAATVSSGRAVTGYTHGDLSSRELGIVGALCREAGTPSRLEPIDERVLDIDLLRHGFERTGNAVFPHWHRAGTILSELGVVCTAAGVFGEILGGHYGPAMLAGNSEKIRAIGALLLEKGMNSHPRVEQRTARDVLLLKSAGSHWYLHSDVERSHADLAGELNAEIDCAVSRLERRGISGGSRLVEAFISEHRGTQYINAQLLSVRAVTDVALPFAGPELFPFASRIPYEVKVHNKLNQGMLAMHAPHLLKYPMAATLLPAAAPLVLQEASRFIRKVYEEGRMKLYLRSGGKVSRPRLSWVDFAFLQKTRALEVIADDLQCEYWNKAAIQLRVRRVRTMGSPTGLHPLYDQLMKVYTVDLALRSGSGLQ